MIILDLETTGLNHSTDRITEIALIELDENGRQEEWSSLVNPGVEISSMITDHTGITNAMVETAPTFALIADSLYTRLTGKQLVAHNAAFDYGFLQAEFERVGLKFETNTMCTVKLSKALFPQYRTHSLDALIERHALPVDERHRALADARVVFHFLRAVEVISAD